MTTLSKATAREDRRVGLAFSKTLPPARKILRFFPVCGADCTSTGRRPVRGRALLPFRQVFAPAKSCQPPFNSREHAIQAVAETLFFRKKGRRDALAEPDVAAAPAGIPWKKTR